MEQRSGNPAELSGPLISIVIPVFNRVGMIAETLESILTQTYQNWEAIVIDDGSNDGTQELIRSIADKQAKIRFFARERDPKGASVCRNIGLAKSSGEYILFLDSDDILAPYCLQQRVNKICEYGNADFLVFKTQLFANQVGDLDLLWNIDTPEDDLVRFLSCDAIWQTSGPIYKKSALLRVGGFKEDLPFWQDYHLHLKCLLSGMTYRKCFDLPPDNFHRKNLKDGISRVTPLVADPFALQTRFDIYMSVAELTKNASVSINNSHMRAIQSMLFFLASAWLMKHNSAKGFLQRWNEASKLTDMNPVKYYTNLIYAFLRFLSTRGILLRKAVRLFEIFAKGVLLDPNIMSKGRIGKLRVSTTV